MKLFDVYPLFDINIVKGEGCHTYDNKGNKYLDLYGGHAVISVGHSHPLYVEALKKQAQQLVFYSNSVVNRLQEELATRLGEASGYDNYSLFLINSGAEANENALKLASFYNGRSRVVSVKSSFHGRTSVAVNITDNAKIVAPINKGFEVTFVPLNDVEAVTTEINKGDVCAVIVEGIQGIGGIKVASDSYLRAIRQACNATNTVMVLDEIQSGYGRSGKFFAHQYTEVKPDIISVAKGMGNGFPVGGILIGPKFTPVYGMLGTTFGGNHLACAAALAVLEIMEKEQLVENAATVGTYLMEELKKMKQIKEVRGLGLMIGLEFEQPVKEIRSRLLYEQKVFTGVTGTNVIRLLPPLCLSMNEANLFLERFSRCI